MNGKFILIFMLCINVVAFGFSVACVLDDEMNCQKIGNDALTKLFIADNSLIINSDVEESGGFAISGEFQNSTESLTKQESGIVSSIIEGFSVFLDVTRIVFAMISLLTPFPILSFFFSLGFPVYVNVIIIAPILILYVISMMEFIKGGSL